MIRARNPIDAFRGLNSSAVDKMMLRRPRPCGLVRLSSSSPRRKSQMRKIVILLLGAFGARQFVWTCGKTRTALKSASCPAGISAAGLTIEFDRSRLYCHPFLRHGERFPSGSVSWTSVSPPLRSGRSNPIFLKAALGLRPILQLEAKKLGRRLFKGLHFFVGSLAPHAELLTNIT